MPAKAVSFVRMSTFRRARQPRADIVVPLEGAGGKLSTTISSPIQVHGITKVPARRAPALGEHNEEVLKQLGFSAGEIAALHASGAVPAKKEPARAAAG